jgi:hypothetical protein
MYDQTNVKLVEVFDKNHSISNFHMRIFSTRFLTGVRSSEGGKYLTTFPSLLTTKIVKLSSIVLTSSDFGSYSELFSLK